VSLECCKIKQANSPNGEKLKQQFPRARCRREEKLGGPSEQDVDVQSPSQAPLPRALQQPRGHQLPVNSSHIAQETGKRHQGLSTTKLCHEGQPPPPSIWCEPTSNKLCILKLSYTLLVSSTAFHLTEKWRPITVRAGGWVPRSPLPSFGVECRRGTFGPTPRRAQFAPSSNDPDF